MIGLGERAGSGIPKIQQGWNELGEIELKESFEPYEQTMMTLTFFERSGSGESGEKILSALKLTPELTIPALAKQLGLSTRAIEKNIAKLKKQEN